MSDNIGDKGFSYDSGKVYEALDTGCDDETLRCLYTEYSERLRNRGSHIWTTGAVFIPLSISGFIVVTNKTVWQLAIGSFLLIWFWFFISEQMRIELERHRHVCAALETAMLERKPPLTKYGLAGLLVSSRQGKIARILHKFTLRRIRFAIPCLITICWLALAVCIR